MALALHALPTASVTPLAIALQRGWQSLWALPRDILELFPPFLLAVPKSKVSHSRKSMRSANKGLKEKFNIVTCPSCGRAKRSHHLCPYCYSELSRGFKTAARQAAQILKPLVAPPADKPLADTKWARERGGAEPVKPGGLLTKWMRARLGLRKADGPQRLKASDNPAP